MKKRIFNAFLYYHGRLLVGFIVIILTFGILGYFYFGNVAQQKTSEQMLHREQVITRAGAKSIESFINLVKKSVLVLSRDPELFGTDEEIDSTLTNFVKDWENTPLAGTILVDKNGGVLYIANTELAGEESKLSFADRDYFLWAKDAEEGEVYVGDPIISRVGATQGQYIITLATPLRDNGEFKGVLVCAILVSKLTENYLNPLKISDQSKVYLVNDTGLMVYSDIAPLLGLNFFDYLNDHPSVGSDLIIGEVKDRFNQIVNQGEGKFTYVRNDYDNQTHLQKWLLAYSTVNIATTAKQHNWILAVETPNEDALVFANTLLRNETYVLVFCIVSTILMVIIAITSTKVREREVYLKGFSQGKKVGSDKVHIK